MTLAWARPQCCSLASAGVLGQLLEVLSKEHGDDEDGGSQTKAHVLGLNKGCCSLGSTGAPGRMDDLEARNLEHGDNEDNGSHSHQGTIAWAQSTTLLCGRRRCPWASCCWGFRGADLAHGGPRGGAGGFASHRTTRNSCFNSAAAFCAPQVPLDELLDDLEALNLEQGGDEGDDGDGGSHRLDGDDMQED